MKLQLISSEGLVAKYSVEGSSPAWINSIRRFSQDYVPTLAFEDLEISQNASALYDDIVAHRIGLIPLTTDLSSYSLVAEGEEVSAMNSVLLSLKVNKAGYVLSGEFESKDPKVKPAFDDIQVSYLLENQELELTGLAVMGQGINHVKWNPCNAFYTYEPIVKVNNASKDLKANIGKYPPAVVEGDKINEKAINTPALIDACDGISDAVTISYNDKNFIFTVESFGQHSPNVILGEAVVQFNKQLDELKSLVKDIKN
jgi:DNA-directed RNA polymerase subunit D